MSDLNVGLSVIVTADNVPELAEVNGKSGVVRSTTGGYYQVDLRGGDTRVFAREHLTPFADLYPLRERDDVRVTQTGERSGETLDGYIRRVDTSDPILPYLIRLHGGGEDWFPASQVEKIESLDEAVAEAIESITQTARERK